MENKYYLIAMAPLILGEFVIIILIEIKMFTINVWFTLLGNFIIAWILFFLYKANKQEAKTNDGGQKQ